MSRVALPSLFCACVLALTSIPAAAAYNHSSGNACQGAFGSTSVFHDDLAAANASQSVSAVFACPINLGTLSPYAYMASNAYVLQYIDHSSTTNFSCYITKAYWNGDQYWSAGLYTCSTWGGCNDPTQSYTGANGLVWSGSEITNVSEIDIESSVTVMCDVPPATNGYNSGRSFVVSYYAAN